MISTPDTLRIDYNMIYCTHGTSYFPMDGNQNKKKKKNFTKHLKLLPDQDISTIPDYWPFCAVFLELPGLDWLSPLPVLPMMVGESLSLDGSYSRLGALFMTAE